MLKADTPVRAEVDMDNGGRVGFKIDVPEDAVLMTIKVRQTPVGLDVMVAKDEPAESPRDADQVAVPEALDTTLRVSCQSAKPLEAGTYYIDVGWLGGGMAVMHKRPIKKIPFTVTVSFLRAKVEGTIKPGEKTIGKIRDEDGSLKVYAVDVPPGAKVLRIDLDDTDGDLDLLASPGRIVAQSRRGPGRGLKSVGPGDAGDRRGLAAAVEARPMVCVRGEAAGAVRESFRDLRHVFVCSAGRLAGDSRLRRRPATPSIGRSRPRWTFPPSSPAAAARC